MNELTTSLQFFASETANIFYCARVKWPAQARYHQQVHLTVFYRPQWKHRLKAYSYTMYQHGIRYKAANAGILPTFEEVLMLARKHGYTGAEAWIETPRVEYHHYIAPIDSETIWTTNTYGSTRELNITDLGKFEEWDEETEL